MNPHHPTGPRSTGDGGTGPLPLFTDQHPDSTPTPRGPSEPSRPARGPGRRVTGDVDLLHSVITTAMVSGYVLAGPAERVYRRVTGDRIEPVPGYEDAAVHQLLRQRLLLVGHTATAGYRGREGPVQVLTVPRATRALSARWHTYQPTPPPRQGR